MAFAVTGGRRWARERREVRQRLEAGRVATHLGTYDVQQLDGLPAPVQRYFLTALQPGQATVSAVTLRQSGSFDAKMKGRWKPFDAEQRVITHRPGFVWDARIAFFPGVSVRVLDAYVAGEGVLVAFLWGRVPLASSRGAPEMARGELMRFLAEAAWYPTALLPSQGVIWEPIDATSANATLTDGPTSVTMQFVFDDTGLIEAVRTPARGAIVGRTVVMTPWEGRFSDYRVRSGMQVPVSAEAAWLPLQGRKPYWRGSIHALDYEFAGTG